MIDEFIGSELENEERADERRDAIRNNLAVCHAVFNP
jgi:hypothetical protein